MMNTKPITRVTTVSVLFAFCANPICYAVYNNVSTGPNGEVIISAPSHQIQSTINTGNYTTNTYSGYLNGNNNSNYKVVKTISSINRNIVRNKTLSYGVTDGGGNIIIQCEYSRIEFDENSNFLVTTKDNKMGVLDKNGKILIKPEYLSVRISTSGKYELQKDWGSNYVISNAVTENNSYNNYNSNNNYQSTRGISYSKPVNPNSSYNNIYTSNPAPQNNNSTYQIAKVDDYGSLVNQISNTLGNSNSYPSANNTEYNNNYSASNSGNIYTGSNTVLQGSVTEIHELYSDWAGADAYNGINRIGSKLVSANNIKEKLQFKVVQAEESNASTDLGNNISVYTGLLKYVETEDELAAVIAHEIGHAEKNHVVHSAWRNGIAATAVLAGSVMTIIGGFKNKDKDDDNDVSGLEVLGELTSLGGEAMSGVNKQFDKGSEYDSDILACDYLVGAGYNPLAMISILNKIAGNYFDWFSDHPSTNKRVENIYFYVKNKYPEYLNKGYGSVSYERALMYIKQNDEDKYTRRNKKFLKNKS